MKIIFLFLCLMFWSGNAYADKKTFVVTPVDACFSKLKPGEESELRRNFAAPWQECQRRMRERDDAAAAKSESKPEASESAEEKKDAEKK